MSIKQKASIAAGIVFTLCGAVPVLAGEITIGVSIPAATHGWTGGLNYYAEDTINKLKESHPEIDYVLATASDATEQVNDIEDLMARKIDALVILPMESAPLTEPVKAIKSQGVYVTVLDRGLAEEGIEDLYVAGDNKQYGVSAAKYFLEKFPEGAKIVVLRGIPTTIDNIRIDAFNTTLQGSKIDVLDMQYANWNPDKAFEVMQDFLQRFPDIDGVWAGDDDPAVGAMEAIRQAGRKGIAVLGGGGMKSILKSIMDGDHDMVDADVLYHPSMIAPAIGLTTLHFATDSPARGTFQIDSQMVTKSNAHLFYDSKSPY